MYFAKKEDNYSILREIKVDKVYGICYICTLDILDYYYEPRNK